MTSFLLRYWDRIRTSFWFLPALMSFGAALLAFGMLALDGAVESEWVLKQKWIYTGGPDGASLVLSTIAGSMVTISGVVFSMTLVALSLASSQLGPRLLREFMRDTSNQVVLGTFISTFIYCLLVLRSIRRAEELEFVPHLSVTLGVASAVASLAVLIYFVHHVSTSIQADEVVGRVANELNAGIERLFPTRLGDARASAAAPARSTELPANFDGDAVPVPSDGDGYVQAIDAEVLMQLARETDVVFRVERRPGSFVVAGSPLVSVMPDRRSSGEFAERVNAAFVLGTQRTSTQDVGFCVDQIAEIAIRALSPGVNDPFTAMTCIDRLGAALCRMAQRERPSPCRYDDDGRLRAVVAPLTFAEMLDAAFHQIRLYARSSAAVSARMLDTIAAIAPFTHRQADRDALRRHADWIDSATRDGIADEVDRRIVAASHDSALAAIARSTR